MKEKDIDDNSRDQHKDIPVRRNQANQYVIPAIPLFLRIFLKDVSRGQWQLLGDIIGGTIKQLTIDIPVVAAQHIGAAYEQRQNDHRTQEERFVHLLPLVLVLHVRDAKKEEDRKEEKKIIE